MQTKGYLHLPLLNAEACTAMRQVYEAQPYTEKETGLGFYTALDQQKTEEGLRNSDRIMHIIRPYLEKYVEDFQVITATFIVKDPGVSNISPIHQDWTFVDERTYSSYMLWCPLQDVCLENGALGLLAETHRLLGSTPRPSPSPPYESVFKDCMNELFGYMDFISMSGGEALLFDHRVLHGAMPNQSTHSRIAFGIGLTHKNAALHHHYLIPNSQQAAILSVDRSFFFKYSNARLSSLYQKNEFPNEYKAIYTYDLETPPIDADRFMKKVQEKHTLKKEVLEMVPTLAQKPSPSSLSSASTAEVRSSDPQKEDAQTSNTKNFWKIYTPKNILKEIQHRLQKYVQA